ncbi:MAG: hypothetical protein KGI25_10330 [Thaumarchaeota archaeon]|nr:hypothetical protein [Nitrososphaerota archaeon]
MTDLEGGISTLSMNGHNQEHPEEQDRYALLDIIEDMFDCDERTIKNTIFLLVLSKEPGIDTHAMNFASELSYKRAFKIDDFVKRCFMNSDKTSIVFDPVREGENQGHEGQKTICLIFEKRLSELVNLVLSIKKKGYPDQHIIIAYFEMFKSHETIGDVMDLPEYVQNTFIDVKIDFETFRDMVLVRDIDYWTQIDNPGIRKLNKMILNCMQYRK